MPRPRNIQAREETANDIKAIARRQLAENGTNGISLRGIAREMGMTAPAIYNYFPKLDDLVTALLVDGFIAHADVIDAKIAAQENPVDALRDGLHMYREWALEHPADFQLLYGTPIPGYEAPREITVPLASRPQESFARCIMEAQEAGLFTIAPDYQDIPQSILDFISSWIYERVPEIKDVPNHLEILYIMEVGFTRIHGIVMLEIHQHLGPTVGDVDSLFRLEVEKYLKDIGLSI